MQPQRTISPVDGRVLVERPLATGIRCGSGARSRQTSVCDLAGNPGRAADRSAGSGGRPLVSRRDELAAEITWQMGRPIAQSAGEIRGLEERARYMLEVAPRALADRHGEPKAGIHAVHPPRTVGTGVRHRTLELSLPHRGEQHRPGSGCRQYGAAQAFRADAVVRGALSGGFRRGRAAGRRVPASAHEPRGGARGRRQRRGKLVAFTGSVPAGRAVQAAASAALIATNLELGGKDPAYVREDADLDHAVANLVDGACFNSGQSCCGIERIYVHRKLFDAFVAGYVESAAKYVLGDPTDPATTLGPMVRATAADFARGQVDEAVAQGARARLDPSSFPREQRGSAYPTWRRCGRAALRGSTRSRRSSPPTGSTCSWSRRHQRPPTSANGVGSPCTTACPTTRGPAARRR